MKYASAALLFLGISARAEPPAIPFTVPPGYTVEKVAGPPLVEHPMFACFDDHGRLYVADSGGKNLKAEDLLKDLPSCIRRLESTKNDGVFDKSIVFADKMSFPMGVLWHDGHVYCCSPPSLWRLTDTNGDGIADERKELVSKFGFIGNAADIHGPWLGPDGWLYWTDGRHGHEIRKPDGTIQTKGKAARIFRCKIDGSNVEVVCGGGMDDPVQLAFTEEGEPFAVVDIFKARPTRVDALIYCIDGGVFPYYEAVLGEFKRTGPLLPAVSELGWVAPSGLIRYRSDHLGKDFTDTMLSTQFNTHKVMRHTLSRVGAGFTSKDEDFITSTNPDFHPTSLVEDADGSLLVIDTGGWFRIGCPTSQVAKPEIKGGIYRVRRKDALRVEDPRGEKIAWRRMQLRDVAKLLGDPRFVVRDRAVAELTRWNDDPALKVVGGVAREGGTPRERINAVWALGRIGTAKSHDRVLECLIKDPSASVRLVAAKCLGENRALPRTPCPGDSSPAVRREEVIALSRSGFDYPPSILEQLERHGVGRDLTPDSDAFLVHAVIHALIVMNQPKATRETIEWGSAVIRRAALIALDQMEDGKLTKQEVLPFLLDADRPLQQAAWHIVMKHSDWFGDVTGLIRKELQSKITDERRELLRDLLINTSQSLNVELFIAEALADTATSDAGRLLLLDVVASADGAKPPPSLVASLTSLLQWPDAGVVRQTIRAIRARGISDCDRALGIMVAKDSLPADVRLAALAAVAPRAKELPQLLFDFALARFADEPRTAAEVLGTAKLGDNQLIAVADLLPRASALEMPRLLDAFRQSSSERVGRALVDHLGRAPGLASVAPADLRAALAKFPAEVRAAAEPFFKKLAVDETAQRQKLAELAGVSEKGDKERGRQLFFGRKALCAACHAVKGEGERIGPDLTKIGSLRTEADLLESVLFPSSSIARGYESVTVHTKDGQSQSGLIRRETADAVFLITTDRTERRYARANIESLEPSRTSIMPQGLEAQLSRQELGDLIAFLRSLK
jgi:putative heme-binding domain-containing protein